MSDELVLGKLHGCLEDDTLNYWGSVKGDSSEGAGKFGKKSGGRDYVHKPDSFNSIFGKLNEYATHLTPTHMWKRDQQQRHE